MDKVSGKWIWTKFNEYTKLMENEALKTEADILQKHCFDGKLFNIHNIYYVIYFTGKLCTKICIVRSIVITENG